VELRIGHEASRTRLKRHYCRLRPSLSTRTHSPSLSFSHPHPIMSQSRSPSDTEERHSSQNPLSKENAGDSPAADNLCPNLDNEVSAARGAGAFASRLPHTRSSCIHPMSCVDLAIPQKREREVSLEAATPHPDDIVRTPDHLALLCCRSRSRLTSRIET
jgi:hypothetical protein